MDNDILFDYNVQIEITIYNSLQNLIMIWSGDNIMAKKEKKIRIKNNSRKKKKRLNHNRLDYAI